MAFRVILFDDDDLMLRIMSKLLGHQGCEVVSYPRAQLLATCVCLDNKTACANALIADNRMPGMSGLELIRRLRERDCHIPHMAIMSGVWTPEEYQQALDLRVKILLKASKLHEVLHWIKVCQCCGDPMLELTGAYVSSFKPAKPIV